MFFYISEMISSKLKTVSVSSTYMKKSCCQVDLATYGWGEMKTETDKITFGLFIYSKLVTGHWKCLQVYLDDKRKSLIFF